MRGWKNWIFFLTPNMQFQNKNSLKRPNRAKRKTSNRKNSSTVK